MSHLGAYLRADTSLRCTVNRDNARKEADPECTEEVIRWNGIHEYRHERVLKAESSSANESRLLPREAICPHSTSCWQHHLGNLQLLWVSASYPSRRHNSFKEDKVFCKEWMDAALRCWRSFAVQISTDANTPVNVCYVSDGVTWQAVFFNLSGSRTLF